MQGRQRTRVEFIAALRAGLAPLNVEEREAAVRYYEEFLDEADDEQAALEGLGEPSVIVERILQENGFRPMQTVEVKTPFYKSAWFWISAVLTLPVTLPLALGLLAVGLGLALGVAGVVLAVGLSLAAVALSIVVCGAALIIAAFVYMGNGLGVFLLMLGAGLALSGLAILIVLGLVRLVQALQRKKAAEKAQPTSQPAAPAEEAKEPFAGEPFTAASPFDAPVDSPLDAQTREEARPDVRLSGDEEEKRI